MSLPLHTRIRTINGDPPRGLHKVLSLSEALLPEHAGRPDRILLDLRGADVAIDRSALAQLGFAGALASGGPEPLGLFQASLADDRIVAPGDVVRLGATGGVSVLFRRGANANSLFVTERCDSRCIMCSQPPRDENDDWRIPELHELLALVDRDIGVLGVTGGEPTLLGAELAGLFEAARSRLPDTRLHVLSNGRSMADPRFAATFAKATGQVVWGIPLYADVAVRHDQIVQAAGAFGQTIHGIYNLAEAGHRIELRCVVHRQTVDRLPALAEFIYRNLPFVEHVALMGLEPMGYARRNRDQLWIDPIDSRSQLQAAAAHLHQRGMTVSIYNTPLCLLDRQFWPLAKQSISDWKNDFPDECDTCEVRDGCSGFFRSAGPGWKSRGIKAVAAGSRVS